MNKSLILAALATAVSATSNAIVTSTYCTDVLSSNTYATYSDLSLAADLTSGGVVYTSGWKVTFNPVATSGDTNYCDHWNDMSDTNLATTYVKTGAFLSDGFN